MTVQAVHGPRVDTTLVFLPRLSAPAVDRPPPPIGRGSGPGGPSTGVVLAANPPPRGFQVVGAVTAVPTDIGPPDPNQRAIDPRDFTGRGVEGGVGWGVVGGTGPADQPMPEAGVTELLYLAETADAHFTPAELAVPPTFVYPRVLAGAGVVGRVVVQFIVDTLGRVEPGSVRILETSHPAFAEATQSGVLEARFRPATFGGHVVRQLSRLPVRYSLRS
jgi:protein TonB